MINELLNQIQSLKKKKTHKNTMTTPSQVKWNKTHIIKKNVQVKMSMSNLDKGTNI